MAPSIIHHHSFIIFTYLCLIIRGALNIQAEIKPIEPVRVMPERDIENLFRLHLRLNFCHCLVDYSITLIKKQ